MLQKRICSSNIYYKDLLTLLRTPSSPFNHSIITRSYQTSKPTIESTSKEITNSPQHQQKDKAPATTKGSNTRNSSHSHSQHKTNKDVTQITNEQIKLLNEKLHIHKLEDWYEVPIRHIKTVVGDVAVLHIYTNTKDLVTQMYPNHVWDDDKFLKQTSRNAPHTLMKRIIQTKRPDVLQGTESEKAAGPVIEEDPPKHIADKLLFEIPNLGTAMLAMYMPLSQRFDPTNWWVFEKFDGIRAIWNCEDRTLYARWGNVIEFPHFVDDVLPSSMWLDGEIWFGRENCIRNTAIKLTNQGTHQSLPWDKLQFMVFDTPDPKFRGEPYHARYAVLQKNVPNRHPFISLVSHSLCTGRDHLESVRSKGGEGVVLRDPNAPYINGYSHSMYKHRGFNDAEALVLEKKTSKTYLCRVDDDSDVFHDIEMTIDDEFDSESGEIEIGKFVSFRYAGEYTSGLPMNPRNALRSDIHNWQQLLHGKHKTTNQRIWASPRLTTNWTDKAVRRKFLDDYAAKIKFDPLVAKNWYGVTYDDVASAKGGGVLRHHNESHIRALMDLYPDIGLSEHEFNNLPMNYYADEDNRKKFFDKFAAAAKFDPLVANNWYHVKGSDIVRVKGGAQVVRYYESYIDAVLNIYPSIGLEFYKFKYLPPSVWEKKENRRKFMDYFATEMGFLPNMARGWYTAKLDHIKKFKGGDKILQLYNGSFVAAAIDLYPELNLTKNMFYK